MDLPLSVADPLFLHELALELKMPVGEMCSRMSNYELCIAWPAYFQHRAKQAEQERLKQEGGR
jgi:hypothetical protein